MQILFGKELVQSHSWNRCNFIASSLQVYILEKRELDISKIYQEPSHLLEMMVSSITAKTFVLNLSKGNWVDKMFKNILP